MALAGGPVVGAWRDSPPDSGEHQINSVWRALERHDDDSITYEHEEVFEGGREQTTRMMRYADGRIAHEAVYVGVCVACAQFKNCGLYRCAYRDHPQPGLAVTTPPPGAKRYVPRGVQLDLFFTGSAHRMQHDPGPEDACVLCSAFECTRCGMLPRAHGYDAGRLHCVAPALESLLPPVTAVPATGGTEPVSEPFRVMPEVGQRLGMDPEQDPAHALIEAAQPAPAEPVVESRYERAMRWGPGGWD
jgi:hypothetical protein